MPQNDTLLVYDFRNVFQLNICNCFLNNMSVQSKFVKTSNEYGNYVRMLDAVMQYLRVYNVEGSSVIVIDGVQCQ
jgi:hypothetical protein